MKKSRSVVNTIREKHTLQGNVINELNQYDGKQSVENSMSYSSDRKTEGEIKRSEIHYKFLNNLFQTIPCAITHFSCNPMPKMKYCNKAAIVFCGFEDSSGYERLLGVGFNRFIPTEWTNYVNHLFAQALEQTEPIDFEYQMCRVDGSVFWIRGILQKIVTEEESVLQSVYMDITKRKSLLNEQEHTASQLQELVENIPAGIVILEVTDRIRGVYANDGFCQLAGYKKEEYKKLMQNDAFFCIHLDDVEIITTALQRSMLGNKPIDVNFRMIHRQQGFRWVNVKAKIIEHNEERVVYYAVFTDVKSLNETQQKADQTKEEKQIKENLGTVLDYAKKLQEAKQEFFLHISQEIYTPLNGIIEMLDLLEQQEHLDENKYLKSAKWSARDLAAVIRNILTVFQSS
ncbi:PAS domain-containing protein [Clostridium aminobutyricum]|uniref:histidine kinase n=1 Tax=Clostridium aminobutyricum TaxID=33953 RepID=A0A939II49_CLOAM|nr:PAS domain-containing protein [Clostridium aminobutyricum]MBN7772124.1 PAS domain-containing protein [Clostridium aminobutyricum]